MRACAGSTQRSWPEPMKVVLFCGGLGLRIQEAAPSIPKPMVPIGQPADPAPHHEVLRPLRARRLHHLPGSQGDVIKDFFLNYNEALANDFVLSVRAAARSTSSCSRATSANGASPS